MIILKFLDGDFDSTTQECSTIDEAIECDYGIWASLGNNCDYYYKDCKLNLDTVNCTREQVKKDIERQIEIIDGI